MRWTLAQLDQSPHVTLDEDVKVEDEAFCNCSLIKGVDNVHIRGKGFLSEKDRFYFQGELTGTYRCLDAITGNPIEVPFAIAMDETYVTALDSDEEEVRIIENETVDLLPAVIDACILEAPLQATYALKEEYPKGDGWCVMSEEDFESKRKQEGNSCFAQLKEDWKEE